MNWAVLKDPTIWMTAAVYGLLAFIATRAGLFGLWLGILLLISLGRYCYAVLRATAQGRERIPAPSIDSCNPVGELMILWHVVLFPGLIVATAPWQPWGTGIAIIVALVFPASAALMGLTGNIAHALDPRALRGVAQTMGRDYLMLASACTGVFLGASALLGFLAARLGAITGVLAFVIDVWALLGVFGLIGTALRAHRLEFDIPGERVPPEELLRQARHDEWSKTLDRAYASIRSGLVSSGYATLRELVAENGDSIEINYWLIENLLAWEDGRYAREVAAKLIPRLIETNALSDALELYQRCRRLDSAFALPAEPANALARFAADIGRHGIAEDLHRDSAGSEIDASVAQPH